MPLSRCKVEIAWGQDSTGLFTFGTSRFGGSDVLAASSWSRTFVGACDDVSADVIDASWSRGRDSDLVSMRAGTATIQLKDPLGTYNRLNAASPIVAALQDPSDNPLRITLYDYLGNAHVRYYGFVQTVQADVAGRGTATITAVDFLDVLNRRKPDTGPLLGATDGSVFAAILDWLEWTDPVMRSLAIGDSIPGTYTRADGSRTGLALTAELLDAERGILFAAASGAVTYLDRRARYLASALGTIDRTLTAFPVATDGQGIVNSWTVNGTDMDDNPVGTPQLFQDDTSIRRHGQIDDEITTPFLANDDRRLALAQYLVLRTKLGLQPVYQVPIDVVDNATQVEVMSRDLGDRETLTVAPLNFAEFTDDFFIESIDERISGLSSPRYSASWRVSSVPSSLPFRFGISTFGGSDALYY